MFWKCTYAFIGNAPMLGGSEATWNSWLRKSNLDKNNFERITKS